MSRYLLLVLFGITAWALAVSPVIHKAATYSMGDRQELNMLIVACEAGHWLCTK